MNTAELPRQFRPYLKYKESGVGWLREIPAHWRVNRLKRVFRVVNGSTPASGEPTYWDGDIPWVTPEDLGDLTSTTIARTRRNITGAGYRNCGTTIVPAGSLVLSTRAPIGHIALAGVDLCTNQGCRSLVFRNAASREFFFFELLAARPELESLGQGSTFRELATGMLEDVGLATPPESEQRAIASFLDRETARIDALVAKKERLIELLQEKRAALITRSVTSGLDPNVPMKDSGIDGLGKSPAHWEVLRIAMAAVKITNGFVGPTRDILVSEGVRYLQSLHIKGGLIDFGRHPYFVTPEWSRDHKKSILAEKDVLVVQTGDIGQVAVVPNEFRDSNCHALIIIRLDPNVGVGPWLARALESNYGQNALAWSQTGALHPHLECGHVREIRIAFPPVPEQSVILSSLAQNLLEVDRLVGTVRAGIERLMEFRSALISAAVTGKIDVRESAA